MRTRLKLFFKWGIAFEDAYSIEEKSERKVQYADSREVEAAVLERFPPEVLPIGFDGEFKPVITASAGKGHIPKTKARKQTYN